jgi:asparagine synthase (glutamine-hydrolysing)
VGAFLSGGIDSSAIVALYQRSASLPVRTFTIGFEEQGFNEADHARAVARHLGTVHHEHLVTAQEARDVIPLLPVIYDEPFADSSQIPTFIISRFARQTVTVALTGDGGDELFAGYNRHIMAPALWQRLSRVPGPVRSIAGRGLSFNPSSFWSQALRWLPGHHPPHAGARLLKGLKVAASARSAEDVFASFLDEWSQERSPVIGGAGAPQPDLSVAGSAVERMSFADAVGYLPDDILCKVDRASMAASLETRVPFLDHRVAAVAARVPDGMKVRDGRGKYILRQLLYRHVPAELIDRPKSGFAVPVGQWIRGPLRDWAEDLLEPSCLAGDGFFDPGPIRHRWAEHLSGRRESTPALWSVLMFQAWLREQGR